MILAIRRTDIKIGIDRGKKWVYHKVYELVKAPKQGAFFFLSARLHCEVKNFQRISVCL